MSTATTTMLRSKHSHAPQKAKSAATASSDEERIERWYPQWRLYHTYGASVISLVAAVGSTVGKISGSTASASTEMVLLIACVGILGIPHGASDHVVIADTLFTYFGRLWLPAFLVVYLGLVALVLYFWTLAPVTALLSFIAISAIHFGLGDVDKELSGPFYLLEVPVRGFMIMVLPCVHHTHNVDRIWTWLVGNEEENRSVQAALEWMHFLMPIWYFCACLIMIYHQYSFLRELTLDSSPGLKRATTAGNAASAEGKTEIAATAVDGTKKAHEQRKRSDRKKLSLKSLLSLERLDNIKDTDQGLFRWTSKSIKHQSIVIELFAIYALFASTSPIVAFIVYFCIWHSARHNFMVAATCFDRSDVVKAFRSFFWASVPFSLGALAMGYAAFLYMHDKPENLIKVQLRMVFIGLNALTIPHMLFIEISDLRRRVAKGACSNFFGLVFGSNVLAQQRNNTPQAKSKGKKL